MRLLKQAQLLIWAIAHRTMAQTATLPCVSPDTLDECTTSCLSAITQFNGCNGLQDCICALVEDVDSDLAACLSCALYYPTVESLITDTIGDSLLGCTYTTPVLGQCSSTVSVPSVSATPSVSASASVSLSASISGPTGVLPTCVSSSLDECTSTCAAAITSFNGCAGLSDCICALVDDVSSDLSACLLCVEIFPTVQPMINDVIGDALQVCDYTLPTISECGGSSTAPVPSSTSSAASTAGPTSGPSSSATPSATPGTTTIVLPPSPPLSTSPSTAGTVTTTVEVHPAPMESSSAPNVAPANPTEPGTVSISHGSDSGKGAVTSCSSSGNGAGVTTVAPNVVPTVGPNIVSTVTTHVVPSVAPNVVSSVKPIVVPSVEPNVVSSMTPKVVSPVASSVVPSGGLAPAGTQGSETTIEQTNGAGKLTCISTTLMSIAVILAMM